ncbi:MAG: asparagine synthase (glutamine-hydrolyzing) [Candidatus Auribacter fodinae]|jgi:asparagine synthase (glutamine-hydrolysing)|uniref:asparagine synthase (glutamine-hydrolyzing) n=1 Tax=Candidatus Auribacter fodinae TaxID=2093366 RepID=A0A3A4RAJ4_9BACT|nr:MAG: asparagine synthase (glutamine-hydrolyzing) [Candidatus Auribacter fodinae]
MCGIGVYISKDTISEQKLADKLNTMNASQEHRGPDFSASYCHGHVGLCHTRLSIIDLSAQANQPFYSPERKYVLSYNGELYNFRELREKLISLGHVFTTHSDTEVVLHSYMEWGTGAFVKFNGMFGLAIYDSVENKVILARDRMGMKFIHYYADEKQIVFASEIKAILNVVGIPEYRTEAVNDFLVLGQIDKTRSFFQGVQTLLPGKFCVVNLSDYSVTPVGYYNLQANIDPDRYICNKSISMEEHVDTLDKLLRKSIEKHLIADIPVGTLCSGGLDSSLVTAIAKQINPDVRIYHGGVEEGGGEEEYAVLAAKHLNVDINFIYMSRDKYLNDLVDTVYQMETPCFHQNDISLYHICKLARTHGVKVLLSGESSDELFAGYPWYPRLMKKTAFADPNGTGWTNDYLPTAGLFYRFPDYYETPRLANAYSLFAHQGEKLLRWNWILDTFGFLQDISEKTGNAILIDNLLTFLNTLLYTADRMGMLSSIENRFPFIENDIVDFTLNLPLEFKVDFRAGKKVLKLVAERYLPKEIIYRRKQGFPTPVESYISFNEAFFKDGFLEQHLSLPASIFGKTGVDKRLMYRLTTAEVWGRIFVLKQNLDEIKNHISATLNRKYQYIS